MNDNTPNNLTKREYFAATAMQAIVVQGALKPNLAVSIAIDYADTLIAMLNSKEFQPAPVDPQYEFGEALEIFIEYISLQSNCGSRTMARKLAPGLLRAVPVLLSRKPELLNELVDVAAEMRSLNIYWAQKHLAHSDHLY